MIIILVLPCFKPNFAGEVLALGGTQALLELSMYIFVLLWVPTLSNAQEGLPLGLLFSLFMLMAMTGSGLAGVYKIVVVNTILVVVNTIRYFLINFRQNIIRLPPTT